MKRPLILGAVFIVPLLLGVFIVGYWYWTTRIDKRAMLPVFGEVPQFALTAEDRRTVTQADLLGKISVVDFIFTECAGACPMMSTAMADLQKKFERERGVQFISVTVDPATDTPEVLARYAAQFGAKSRTWSFLTGAKPDIVRLMKDGFHLGLDVGDDSAIVHSQKFVLVDQRGAIRGYYESETDMQILERDAGALARRLEP